MTYLKNHETIKKIETRNIHATSLDFPTREVYDSITDDFVWPPGEQTRANTIIDSIQDDSFR
jgi:hypothetical protein